MLGVWCSVFGVEVRVFNTKRLSIAFSFNFFCFGIFLKPFPFASKASEKSKLKIYLRLGFLFHHSFSFDYKKKCTRYYLVRSNNSFREFYCIACLILFLFHVFSGVVGRYYHGFCIKFKLI